VTPTVGCGYRKTFAESENGLNIPFGMAFANGSFFLGNTDAVLKFPCKVNSKLPKLVKKSPTFPVAAATGRAMSLSHRMGKRV